MNTKTVLKTTAALLAALMFISLAACSSGGRSEKTDNTANVTETAAETLPEDTSVKDDLPDENFGGYKYRILSSIRGKATLNAFPAEQSGDTLNDVYYKRNLEVAQRFGVEFYESTEGDGLSISFLEKDVLAGLDSYDLYQVWDRIAIQAAERGYITPVEELDAIDLSKPYWSSINDQLTINRKLYFAVGDENPVLLTGLVVLFFNRDMADSFGIGRTTMYEDVRSGDWTIDKFYGYARSVISDLNGNGKVDEDDIYGISTNRNTFFLDFFAASGVRMVDKDADDLPYLAFMSGDRFAAIYDKVLALTFNDPGMILNTTIDKLGDAYSGESDYLTQTLMHFGGGHSLFSGMTLSRATTLRAYDLDYGVLPFPKYEECAAGSPWPGRTDSLVPYVVPITNKDTHRTGVIFEALACSGHNIVVPAYYNVVLGEKETRDRDSVEMLEIMFSNRCVELESVYWATRTVENLMTNNNQGFASQAAALESKLNAKLEATIETFKKLG